MIDVASAKINSFAPVPQNDNVPQEEPIFVLTSSELQDIIKEALQPALDRIESMEATVTRQDEKITTLEARIGLQEDNGLIQLRLIHDLREATRKGPGKITANQENRIKILRSLLAARGGKMLTKEARQIMKMDKGAFSRLVAAMPTYIETKTYSMDRKQTLLILKIRPIVDDNNQQSNQD
jgi:hypothetical protein